MRVLHIVIVLFLLGVPLWTFSQQPMYFGDAACLPAGKPQFLKFGDQLVIQCDTAYLINVHRYKLYEKARNYVLSMTTDNENNMLEAYEAALQQSDQFSKDIRAKYDLMSDEMQEMIRKNKATLEQVNRDLEKAKTDLNAATKQVEEAKNKLQREIRLRKGNRLVFGSIGVGVGILAGALLFR